MTHINIKMKENKHTLCLTYGPREDEVLSDINTLVEREILPDNRNEVFRRGVHVVKHLAEVDERPLLDLLFQNLNFALKNDSIQHLNISESLSVIILATLISKYGVLRSETFETIPVDIKRIKHYQDNKKHEKFDAAVKDSIGKLATSLDTIFIKHPLTAKPSE
jgi:hypothetical protein